MCIAIDSLVVGDHFGEIGSHQHHGLASGFYYRKTVNPPVWFKYFMLFILVAGILNHIKLAFGIIRTDMTPTRRLTDALLLCLFLFNLYFTMTVTAPLEKKIGDFYIGGAKSDDAHIVHSLVQDVSIAHIISTAVLIGMIVLNFLHIKYVLDSIIKSLKRMKRNIKIYIFKIYIYIYIWSRSTFDYSGNFKSRPMSPTFCQNGPDPCIYIFAQM